MATALQVSRLTALHEAGPPLIVRIRLRPSVEQAGRISGKDQAAKLALRIVEARLTNQKLCVDERKPAIFKLPNKIFKIADESAALARRPTTRRCLVGARHSWVRPIRHSSNSP